MSTILPDTLIVIPARWGSTRFPGKPLALLRGVSLLQRVYGLATQAADILGAGVVVATDDMRIANHVESFDGRAVITPASCINGTERAYHTAFSLPSSTYIKWVINLQCDAPLTPIEAIISVATALRGSQAEVATCAMRLSWDDLDALRKHKVHSPFSGTTVVFDGNHQALWFSKSILPVIRSEDRSGSTMSPVYRHVGVYGYTLKALNRYAEWPEADTEKLEGLEQLRFLENRMPVQVATIDNHFSSGLSGIDTPADLVAAEAILAAAS